MPSRPRPRIAPARAPAPRAPAPPPGPRAAADPLQQHDLRDQAAAALARAAGPLEGATVVEAGAGTGALTAALLDAGARVLASERDPQRVAALRLRFADALAEGRLRLHPDAVSQPLPAGDRWRAVANPPFQITAALIRRWLLEPAAPPAGITLLLQREAAQKLCGAPGAHTRSSALLAAAGAARVALRLPREAVQPPSRVDLAVWSWTRRAAGASGDELRYLDRLLERAFAGPHTVAEALRGVATAVQLRRQGAEQQWDPQAHPRTLSAAAWRALAAILAPCGKL
jgi:16S rRNA (adenine1518-N6/adenine1519-N6)-dimethyltransferase